MIPPKRLEQGECATAGELPAKGWYSEASCVLKLDTAVLVCPVNSEGSTGLGSFQGCRWSPGKVLLLLRCTDGETGNRTGEERTFFG